MNILIVHNPYSQRGGEDRVAELQAELLAAQGHTVVRYERSYAETKNWRFGRFTSFFSALYNRRSVREIKEIIARKKPDIALIHNLFPVISPAILPPLHRAGVSVIQVVHNYRLGCPTGLAFRADKPCQECPRKGMMHCVWHQCEGSLLGSVAFALRSIRARSIYRKNVDFYSAVSCFVHDQLVAWGSIPVEKSGVLGNPVTLPHPTADGAHRTGVLFVGRFTTEKGAETLLEVARRLPDVPFTVTGQAHDAPVNVHFVGIVDRATLDTLYRSTRIVVAPSKVEETFGLAAAEGMAAGAVAVVSDRGALPELVEDGAGVCVAADDIDGWVAAIERLLSDQALWADYAKNGQQRIAERYAASDYAMQLNRQIQVPTGTR